MPFQHVPGLCQVGLVEHFAIQPDSAGTGISVERLGDALGMGDVGWGGGKAGVDCRDLAGVDGEPGSKAFAVGLLGRCGQPVGVTEISVERFDRFYSGGTRGHQAHGPDHFIGERPLAIWIAVGRGSERGGEVFGAPSQPPKPGQIGGGIVAQFERRGGGFGGDGKDADVVVGVGRVQQRRQVRDIGGADGFGQDDPVGAAGQDGGKVVFGHVCIKRVHPDPDLRLPRGGCEDVGHKAAGGGFLGGGDGVFEIEDDGVGA